MRPEFQVTLVPVSILCNELGTKLELVYPTPWEYSLNTSEIPDINVGKGVACDQRNPPWCSYSKMAWTHTLCHSFLQCLQRDLGSSRMGLRDFCTSELATVNTNSILISFCKIPIAPAAQGLLSADTA